LGIIQNFLNKLKGRGSKSNPAQAQELSPAQAKPKFRIIYLYILVVCLGLFIGNLAFTHYLYPKITTQIKKEKPAQTKQNIPIALAKETTPPLLVNPVTTSEPLPTPAPEPEIIPAPVLVLTGVFFEKNFGYAIINNQIVKTGDTISQAKVKQISLEGVELEFDGKIIKLTK